MKNSENTGTMTFQRPKTMEVPTASEYHGRTMIVFEAAPGQWNYVVMSGALMQAKSDTETAAVYGTGPGSELGWESKYQAFQRAKWRVECQLRDEKRQRGERVFNQICEREDWDAGDLKIELEQMYCGYECNYLCCSLASEIVRNFGFFNSDGPFNEAAAADLAVYIEDNYDGGY